MDGGQTGPTDPASERVDEVEHMVEVSSVSFILASVANRARFFS